MKRLTLIALAIAAVVLPCSPAVATSTGALHAAALVVKVIGMVPPPGYVL